MWLLTIAFIGLTVSGEHAKPTRTVERYVIGYPTRHGCDAALERTDPQLLTKILKDPRGKPRWPKRIVLRTKLSCVNRSIPDGEDFPFPNRVEPISWAR